METSRSFDQYQYITKVIRPLILGKYEFYCDPPLTKIVEEFPKLIWVFNHRGLLSWMSFVWIPCLELMDNGKGYRKPLVAFQRSLYKIPILKQFVKYISNSNHSVTSKEEAIQLLKSDRYSDLSIMPEGDYCNFGNVSDIRPFKSAAFIEIAVKVGCPILVMTCTETADINLNISLSEQALKIIKTTPILNRYHDIATLTGSINIPILFRKTKFIKVKSQLYFPTLTLTDLRKENKTELIWKEAEYVRSLMQEMQQALKK